jgi:hypothetical protein
MFCSALLPWTNGGSNLFAKGDSEWRALDKVGAVIEKEPNDGRLPNLKHLDEWDTAWICAMWDQELNEIETL